MWYLQFHVVCDKVCTSFNGLLFIICPPLIFMQLPDRILILSKGVLFLKAHR